MATTELVKYVPVEDDGVPSVYADRVYTRTVSISGVAPFLQFWLMADDGRNCFASGSSVQAMLESARRREELESRLPSFYQPELSGYTFSTRAPKTGNVLEHLCISPDGVIAGFGDGRDAACEMALRIHYANVPVDEMPFEVFEKISFPVAMRFSGRDGYLIDGHLDGMDSLRKATQIIYELNSSLHGSVKADPKRGGSDREAFVSKRVSEIVRTPLVRKASSGVLQVDLSLGPDVPGSLSVVFYNAAKFSKEQALRASHGAEKSRRESEFRRGVETG